VIPSGGTVLEAGDRMMVLADQESIAAVQSIFSRTNSDEALMSEPETNTPTQKAEEEDARTT
jgi:hypothetical protein